MQRIVSRSNYIIPNTTNNQQIQADVNSAKNRWQLLSTKIQNLVINQTKFTSKIEKFDALKDTIKCFLGDTELALISLDPSTSDEQSKIKLEKLKVYNCL